MMSFVSSLIQKWSAKRTPANKIWIAVALTLVTIIIISTRFDSNPRSDCQFPAIFNFGDSNSDTGGNSAAFGRVLSPNGGTFFGRPAGRYSDGRLIIDFIAERLRVPYLNAYLDSFMPEFRHGVNFAQAGSTIQSLNEDLFKEGYNPFSLNLQVVQFEEFKARVLELYEQGKWSGMKSRFPKPSVFTRAIYTIDSGQNDLHAVLTMMTGEKAIASIPSIINHFGTDIERLYGLGARTFWIHNTGPIGCLPFFIINYRPKSGDIDAVGCMSSFNEIAQEFNKQLKEKIALLRTQLGDAALNYVDIYTAKYSLIKAANSQGFVDPLGFCCKHHEGNPIGCWEKRNLNGTEISPSSCDDPLKYISWDSIHYTEAASKWVSDHILNGSFSDPHCPHSKYVNMFNLHEPL